MNKQNRFYPWVLLGLTLALAACDGGTPDNAQQDGQGTVTVMGVIVGEQQEKLEAALAPFEQETGIDVIYEGTAAFATLLPVRVDSGNAPDVAMFPQPGLMADFAREGSLIPISDFIDEATLTETYSQDWIDLATVDGQAFGLWYRAFVKSLVWYSPAAFEAAGYETPETWDEMMALTEQIVADGNTPWCLGIENGDATGWVGTDWVEDILLRTAGPDAYDQWITHEIPFNAPEVKAAFERFGGIALNENYVVGGTVGVLSTPFGDSPNGLFADPPECYLHRQASFIASFFPEDVTLGEDVSIFPLPGIDPAYGVPVLVSGDIFTMLNATPEAQALMEYVMTTQPHEIWAQLGGYLSPHQQVSLDVYPDPVTRRQAEILANADIIRFDGSDTMPGAVGTGSFWTGVTSYVGGADLDTVLQDIQASWPQ